MNDINKLIEEGYENLSGIDINVSKNEIKKRILSAGVDKEIVKKIFDLMLKPWYHFIKK
ncbi:MAG: hypothetical protein ACI4XR_03770 [Bacilli bacterium]